MIIPPIGSITGGLSSVPSELLGEASSASVQSAGQGAQPSAALEGTSGESGGFGGALTEAISSLDKAQQSADTASQALATGSVSDPESAIVTVENAQLEMELASQIRTKATEAAQSIFQTQV